MLHWHCGRGLFEARADVSGTSMMDEVGSLTCSSLLETHLGILTLSGFNLMTLRFSLTSSGIEMAHVCEAVLFLQCSAFAQMSGNFGTIHPTFGISRTFNFHS